MNFVVNLFLREMNMNWKTKLKNNSKNIAKSSKNFLIYLTKRAQSDNIMRVASSLSYTSLIAIVPLFAIALAIFSAFPVFSDVKSQVQEFLLQSLAPSLESDLSSYLDQFIGATAKLTTIGVAGIAITAVMLLSTIENSLNFIFKVSKPRRLTTKITLYWTIITLGPLLLGTAFSLRSYMSLQNIMPDDLAGTTNFISGLIPSIITMIVLMLIYILVPNKKVNISNAFIGSLVTVIAFAIMRKAFASFILKSATYKTLYGAMAILPIFLVWMYMAWAVVIFGAVLTAALEDYRNSEQNSQKPYPNKKFRRFNKKTIDNRTKTEHSVIK